MLLEIIFNTAALQVFGMANVDHSFIIQQYYFFLDLKKSHHITTSKMFSIGDQYNMI